MDRRYNSAGDDLDEADNPWLTRDDADFLNWEKVPRSIHI